MSKERDSAVHMQGPLLRIVSLHPLLSLILTFLRVPEVYDGFKWTVFIGKDASVGDVIDGIVDELGLIKQMPGSKLGETVNYALQQQLGDSTSEFSLYTFCGVLNFCLVTPLSPSDSMMEVLRMSAVSAPGEIVVFYFCIPNEWFLRSRPAARPMEAFFPENLQDRSTTTTNSEHGDTAQQTKAADGDLTPSQTSSEPRPPEWRNSVAQNRLMSFLTGWSQPAPAITSTGVASANRKSISDPLLKTQNPNNPLSPEQRGDDNMGWSDIDAVALERCLVC